MISCRVVARPGLEPSAFRWPCEHSTTELPSHPAISPTTFHLKPTPVTHFPGLFKFVHEFPVEKSTNFLYPFAKDIHTKLPLRSWLFMLGAICNRWKIGAQPELEPRAFRWPCEHSITELPSHAVISPTTFHLKPTPVTRTMSLYVYSHASE